MQRVLESNVAPNCSKKAIGIFERNEKFLENANQKLAGLAGCLQNRKYQQHGAVRR